MGWDRWIPFVRGWLKRLRRRNCARGLHTWTSERVKTAEGKPSRIILNRCMYCSVKYTSLDGSPQNARAH